MYNTAEKETTPSHDVERLLTMQEAADLLAVHRGTVVNLIKRGELDASKIGGQWRIKPSSLKRLIDKAEETGK